MIAAACDTYDRVSAENRETLNLRMKVGFLADYVFDWIGGRLAGDRLKYRYMYMVDKVDESQIIKRWEGKIRMF